MALTAGTRLGPYEIHSAIGAGGMGEVYRARDSRLGRDVAIKVLPSAFSADPERLHRFEQEARAAAALNHPNILAVYDIGTHDGAPYIVSELLDGETLRERLSEGALPVRRAVDYAVQISQGLAAAHEKGITHRDLKPENIFLTTDGRVKILDFGLAKLTQPDAAVAGASALPTTPPHTQAGMVLGTVGYMAPEQAKGRTVDRRSDIWAFGAVLYEMLTGTRAFAGDDITDTLANVLKVEPDWHRLPAEVSPGVRLALRACLRKDPKQRIGDMQSVRLALEGAFETTAPQTTASSTSAAARGRLAWITALAVAAVVIAAMAVPTVRYLRETPPPAPPETRVEINTPATDRPTDFALSPDGRQIAFVASGDGASRLWLRSLAATTAQPLAGTEGAIFPFWAPDGRAIGFFAGNALERLDLVSGGGGVPQTLVPVAAGRSGTWNADGVILFAPTGGPLMRVSGTGGAAVAVTTLDPEQTDHFAPYFLPDGRRFLFRVNGAPDTAGIYLGALDGSAPTRLTAADSAGVYLPAGPGLTEASRGGGWLLWVRAGTLVAQRLEVAGGALTGEPVTLADGVAVDTNGRSAISVAATGLVAYRTGAGDQRQLAWFDRSGTARGTVGDPDATLQDPRVSPDGHRVAVGRTVQGNEDVWLLDGARPSRFTFDAAPDDFPLWSPDGTRIVFRSDRTGCCDLYQKLMSSAGMEERLVASDQPKNPTSWSADGHFLLYHSADPQSNGDLWVVPMVGDHTPSVFLKTPFREAFGAFSPDGRWVAYQLNESGRPEIYVRPFVPPGAPGAAAGAAGGQSQVSTTGGIIPVWRPDGKELYYLNPAGAMMAAPITVTGATLEPGAPVVLFPTHIVGGGADVQVGRNYDVAPDGRFLINTELGEAAAAPITLLQNWNPDAKK